MNKSKFLDTLRVERSRWAAALAQISQEQPPAGPIANGWALKDLIAHMLWYEREMVALLNSRNLESGSELWSLPHDQRNQAITHQSKSRPLPELLNEAETIYDQLFEALTKLEEEAFFDAGYFANMPPDWVPWEMIAGNCFEHYQQHSPELEAWLESDNLEAKI